MLSRPKNCMARGRTHIYAGGQQENFPNCIILSNIGFLEHSILIFM